MKSSVATCPLKFVLACTAGLFVSLFKKVGWKQYIYLCCWNSRVTFVIMPHETGVYVEASD